MRVKEAPEQLYARVLGTIQPPVRIVWGERDAWLDPAFAHRLREVIPGAELALIPDAGHFSMLDRPEAVTRELSDFFDTV